MCSLFPRQAHNVVSRRDRGDPQTSGRIFTEVDAQGAC